MDVLAFKKLFCVGWLKIKRNSPGSLQIKQKSMWWGGKCNIELGPAFLASKVFEAKINCHPDQCVAGYKRKCHHTDQ